MVVLQRKWFEVISHNGIGFLQHLGLSNPECSLGDRTGEIVDFDAVELVDRNFDWISQTANHSIFVKNLDGLVLQSAEAGIGFRQEITRPTSRIQELQTCELVLEFGRSRLLRPDHFLGLDIGKFSFQVVQEERVDDLVDILQGGIMHAAGPAGIRVQGRLEYGAEDGRRYQAPVKIVAGPLQDEGSYLFRDSRNLDIPGEHTSADERECCQFLVHVWITVFRSGVQHLKQLDERFPEFVGRELVHVIMEHILGSEDPGILGIHAENQTHTKLVQALLAVGILRMDILGKELLIEDTDDFTSLDTDFQFLFQMDVGIVNEERKPMKIFLQVL